LLKVAGVSDDDDVNTTTTMKMRTEEKELSNVAHCHCFRNQRRQMEGATMMLMPTKMQEDAPSLGQ
jgi:hypothetical protein